MRYTCKGLGSLSLQTCLQPYLIADADMYCTYVLHCSCGDCVKTSEERRLAIQQSNLSSVPLTPHFLGCMSCRRIVGMRIIRAIA